MKLFIDSFNTRLWLGTLISSVTPWLILSPFIDLNTGFAYSISMILCGLGHFINAKLTYVITVHPGRKSGFIVIPNTLLCFFFLWVFAKFLSLPYSLKYLAIGGIASFICSYVGLLYRTNQKQIFAFIPLGRAKNTHELPDVEWLKLQNMILPNTKINGIVADLHDPTLADAWQTFLANQTLTGMPVYHIRTVEENLTGRVKIHHMYENNLGSLLPSGWYMSLKRVIDTLIILLTLPLTLPIMAITAIAIKLNDGGSILYTQQRIGYRGIPFKMYKFRSMSENRKLNKQQNTVINDARITYIGTFIRKTRIDEFPQFFNVLVGEMSLIGPRAEFKDYAEELEKSVPFFNYRHIVRPGISGWAQVMHGYAIGTDETKIKIEYDFYYIKHFSLSLDIVIFFKTIRTMLTGFGAR